LLLEFHILLTTAKDISFLIILTRSVYDEEIEVRQELHPTGLLSGEYLRGHEILQGSVVRIYSESGPNGHEFRTPLVERSHDRIKFFVVDFPIRLMAIQDVGVES